MRPDNIVRNQQNWDKIEDKVAFMLPAQEARRKSVRNTISGKVFKSITEAAQSVSGSKTGLSTALKKTGLYKGQHYCYEQETNRYPRNL